jgi:hypothetical protein
MQGPKNPPKKDPAKIPPDGEKPAKEELTDEQLEQVAGGATGPRADVVNEKLTPGLGALIGNRNAVRVKSKVRAAR